MILIAKICVTLGVVLNFVGSLMLLRDFRDIIQLPFFRWQTKRLKAEFQKELEAHGDGGHSYLARAMKRHGLIRTFGFVEMLRAPPKFRNLMQINNQHNSLRKSLQLDSYLIIGPDGLGRYPVEKSFREIDQHLLEWSSEPDPESSTDRVKALKFFIWGFGLLTLGAILDLVGYLLGYT